MLLFKFADKVSIREFGSGAIITKNNEEYVVDETGKWILILVHVFDRIEDMRNKACWKNEKLLMMKRIKSLGSDVFYSEIQKLWTTEEITFHFSLNIAFVILNRLFGDSVTRVEIEDFFSSLIEAGIVVQKKHQ
jgi:hypothetical protein